MGERQEQPRLLQPLRVPCCGGARLQGPPWPWRGEAAHAVPWQSVIPNPGGDFTALSLGRAFGVEFYQQQLSKINKKACACQCERGSAADWQSGTINYRSALLPACQLRERWWQRAGDTRGRGGDVGAMRGENVVLGAGGVVPRWVKRH